MRSAELPKTNSSWKQALNTPRFVAWAAFSVVTIALLGLLIETYFQDVILNRPGVLLNDYVLNAFKPVDWSLEIMTIIYSSILLSIAMNISKPWTVVLMFSTYAVVTWMRMLSMYLLTLEAPIGVIPLHDPFLSMVVYQQQDFVKDLFFSGHVSSMCVLIAVEENRIFRWILIVLACVMTTFILWQHVHYTLDVVVAPVASFGTAAILRRTFLKTPPIN